MARSYPLESIDLDFFESAPVTYRIDVNLPVTPQRAWAEFTRQNTLDWCRAIKSIEFTSPPPYGVGTTRKASLGVAGLSEHFFVWDEDDAAGEYRNAFYAASASTPGLKRFGELTEVRPAEVGCRLIWSFALELATSAKAVTAFSGPTAATVFKTVETDTIRHFAKFAPQS
ncbi:SRPBCC family protein [Gordonia sp. SID5947]|uniref:SRPBCC family protein n=1 Tax=Gordonia sp. SID5947 TaxID=2690315 RepID=UPI00137192F1|nr:SRPBCC family protein [Gordonia sp. SID5947]MYR06317.1 SRPBCC family protein [Gordonia sp. SID5947]